MYQSFRNPSEPATGAGRIRQLRALLSETKIDAFLVPRADEHQGEYVPRSAERLAWLTGFTGSAGMAVVTRKAAALLVDGRYTLQAGGQVDTGVIEILQTPEHSLSDWLGRKLSPGTTVGFDPWLHTISAVERLTEALAKSQIKLRPVGRNLVDRIWGSERPAPSHGAISIHPQVHAGRTAEEKVADIKALLVRDKQDAAILTLPDSIAWLFNIRGSDVAHNPVPLAFAVLPAEGKPELYVAPEKLTREVREYLAGIAKVRAPDELATRLAALKSAKKRVRVDPDTAAWWFLRRLGKGPQLVRAGDPCILPKARKNAGEIAGARAAHLRDGVAMVRFLAWLDRTVAGDGTDEITAVEQLERFRSDGGLLREISFDTISGSGPNGAIVHYRVDSRSNRRLQAGELFLLDSGGQYADGTTDVTRTIAIGTPSQEMRDRFTRVLKGHIAIATSIFPVGTRGIEIDAFARRALWTAGLDFDHGTGHGVGSFLSVHEGPQSISRRGMAELHPGMIVSNEPGYYKTGKYGIRIEALLLIGEPAQIPGGDRKMMRFETLTLVPIDRRLVDPALLNADERAWLDAYHARVAAEIGPLVKGEDRAWLKASCKPIGS